MKAARTEFAANGFRTARLLPCSRKNFAVKDKPGQTGYNLLSHAGEEP
jgi:hypothetical protein